MNKYAYLTIVYAIIIFIISSIPTFPPGLVPVSRLVYHAIEFSILGFLLFLTLRDSKNKFVLQYLLLTVFIIGALYGVSDEIHQYFVPGRVMDLLDMAANATGVLIGGFVAKVSDKFLKL